MTTNKQELKKYLNGRDKHKYTCLHNAVKKSKIKMCKKLIEIGTTTTKDILNFNLVDNTFKSPIDLMFETSSFYPMIKMIWNCETVHDYRSGYINSMIRFVVQNQNEYDENAISTCGNFVWFKDLMNEKGINKSILLKSVFTSKRLKYLQYILETADVTPYEFWSEAIDHSRFWSLYDGTTESDLINVNNISQLQFGSLTDDDILRLCVQLFSQTTVSETFKSLIFSQKQTLNIFSNDNGGGGVRILKLLDKIFMANEWSSARFLFDMCSKQGWIKQFSPQNTYNIDKYIDIQKDPCYLMVKLGLTKGDYCTKLYNTGMFDINFQCYNDNLNPLLACASGSRSNTTNSSSYKLFTYLLDYDGIDVTVKDKNGSNIIYLLKCKEKSVYLDYLEERINSYKSSDNKEEKEQEEKNDGGVVVVTGGINNNNNISSSVWSNLNEMMSDTVEKYNTVLKLVQHARNGSYQDFTKYFEEIRSQFAPSKSGSNISISELLNSVATSIPTESPTTMPSSPTKLPDMITPLVACITSQKKYDKEKPLSCDNFRLFEYILKQKEIDLEKIVKNKNIAQYCLDVEKIEFWKYLISLDTQHGKILSTKQEFVFPRMLIYPTLDVNGLSFHDNLLYWAIGRGNFKLFSAIYEMILNQGKKIMDVNELLHYCCETSSGYPKNATATGKEKRECDNFQIFVQLLNNIDGIDVNYVSKKIVSDYNVNSSPIRSLVITNKDEHMKYLIEFCNKKNIMLDWSKVKYVPSANILFYTPVHPSIKMVDLLLKNGLSLKSNGLNDANETLLIQSAQVVYSKHDRAYSTKHKAYFDHLVNNYVKSGEIDWRAKNNDNEDVIDVLLHYGSEKENYINYLVKICNIDPKIIDEKREIMAKTKKFCMAAYGSQYNELKELIGDEKEGKNLGLYINKHGKIQNPNWMKNYVDRFYCTPIEACIMTNCQSNNHSTKCNSYRCFELLINALKNVSQLDFGKIFLKCVQYRRYAMIEYLIKNKNKLVDIDTGDEYGNGKSIDTTDSNGNNCLITAVGSSGNYELVPLLLKSKLFNINYYKPATGSVLHYISMITSKYCGFEIDTPMNCKLFNVFKALINEDNIDLNIRGVYGLFVYTSLCRF